MPTLDELKALPLRELDARALMACCGWRWMRHVCGCALLPPEPADWYATGVWKPSFWCVWNPVEGVPREDERARDWDHACRMNFPNGDYRVGMPRPSESIADAYELEEAVAKAGRDARWRYVGNVIAASGGRSEDADDLWLNIHATPLQRTFAAVLTMETPK